MHFFITGATGYVGSVVAEKALAQGHIVHGLSRSEEGAAKLRQLGATPVHGDLTTLDVLQEESAKADVVLHLAFIHDFAVNYDEILRIDAAAVDAMSKPLRGTNKPLVMTGGTMVVGADPNGEETTEDAPPEKEPFLNRIQSERYALSLSEKGVRVISIRLAPYVYGRGGSTFIPLWMQLAAKSGEAAYIGDGNVRTSSVHVDDAAELYFLAAKDGKAGDIFNGASATNITTRELIEAIGAVLKVPVRSIAEDEAKARWGPLLTRILLIQNRASHRKAAEQLGWKPNGVDMLTDIRAGSYSALAEKLRQ
jgi:nucleoside-diphosphate-sugar epimerase